jgi:hypothetical protein
MDKDHDGKLSKKELEAAFKRANRIEYWCYSVVLFIF